MELSIQVSLDGLSFCVLDTTKNRVVAFREYTFEKVKNPFQLMSKIEETFAEESWLQNEYKKVHVVHQNYLSTFVPKPLFSDKNLSDYLKFNHKILENDYVTFDVVRNSDMVNVYVPYVNVNNFLIDRFGAFDYHHFSTILIEKLQLEGVGTQNPTMYVNMRSASFEIVVLKQRRLEFYNSFVYETKEDFIYYLLFTAEQLGLNPEEFNLIFLGRIKEEDECFQIAYNYVRNVSILDKKHPYVFEEGLDLINNEHFTLLHSF